MPGLHGGGLAPRGANLWKTDPTPIVSVGNLAAGGRGKTPAVACIARLLLAAGERPAILSRGYGRREVAPGAVVVSDGHEVRCGIDRSGDEPLMLARAVPGAIVVVSEDRRVAASLAGRHLGATVHILDDGFQHRRLARDVDLVLVTAADLTARAFPFGPLRESPGALSRADAIVVDPGTESGESVAVAWPAVPATRFGLRRRLGPPVGDGREWTPSRGPIVVFAGIARPGRVADSLASLGWQVAELVAFRDHHRYRTRDVARINAAARRTGATGLVTTAKDAVRLPPDADWALPLGVAELEATITPEDTFRSWLLARLAEARR